MLEKGRVLGNRYRIQELLGLGGMGAVYSAEHVVLGRQVAIKVLLDKFFDNEEMRQRFMREAKASSTIRHPAIAEVYDLGFDEELTYIAMELLEGEELRQRMSRHGPLPIPFVLEIGCDIADAITAAHEHGIIHRDLKPQNIFLAKEGNREEVKVLDFGFAKVIDALSSMALTKTGEVFGTPVYIPPEQLKSAKHSDARVDVYSIGIVLWEALTGAQPYAGRNFFELVLNIATKEPLPLENFRTDIPPDLAHIVTTAMAKNPEERFQTAAALSNALASCLGAW